MILTQNNLCRFLNGAYDSFLVVMDRFTKYAIYIPARKDWKVENLADALAENVFKYFGMPVSIVSDRGSLFTSHFWSAFCYHLTMALRYSTAFHPQTNEQTVRQKERHRSFLKRPNHIRRFRQSCLQLFNIFIFSLHERRRIFYKRKKRVIH